jgi:hypothetical protein
MKIKYFTRTSEDRNTPDQLQIREYKFEKIETFKYLGSTVTTDNNVSVEIQVRLMAGNRCHYALQNVLKSKNISWEAKLNTYKTIIRPTVTYGCQAWTLKKEISHASIYGRRKYSERYLDQ